MWRSRPGLIVALGIGATLSRAAARADSADFKFPLLLCIHQYSMVDEKDGRLQPIARSTEIQAYPVHDIRELTVPGNGESAPGRQVMSGEVSGEYDIEGSSYRSKFDAKIVQGLGDGKADEIKLESVLERKPVAGDKYQWAGQRTSRQTATEGADGSIWKDAYARAENSLPEMDEFRDGNTRRFDLAKVEAGIAQGKLTRGAVFQAGPVCALMDLNTVKRMNFRQDSYMDIFRRADQRKALLARIESRKQENLTAEAPLLPEVPPPPAAIPPAADMPQGQADAAEEPVPTPTEAPESSPGAQLPEVAIQTETDPSNPQADQAALAPEGIVAQLPTGEPAAGSF